jgi:hypothetical protein
MLESQEQSITSWGISLAHSKLGVVFLCVWFSIVVYLVFVFLRVTIFVLTIA